MSQINHHETQPDHPRHQSQPPAADGVTEAISLLFEIDRNDNPLLYDDLIRFKKGTKRVNRLRFLAHEGVVAQVGMYASGRRQIGRDVAALGEMGWVPPVAEQRLQQLAVSPGEAAQISQVFSHPLEMEED